MKKKTEVKSKKAMKKIVSSRCREISKEEFLQETEKISVLIRELKNEMNEKFEKHENIILAEYRHRIEALETKVGELQAIKK